MGQTIVQSLVNQTSEPTPMLPARPAQLPAPPNDDLTRWVELLNKALPLLAVAGGAVAWLTQNPAVAGGAVAWLTHNPVVTLVVIGLVLIFYSLFTIFAPRVQSQFRSGLLGVLVLLASIILWFLLTVVSRPPEGPLPGPNSLSPSIEVVPQSEAPPAPSVPLLTLSDFVEFIRRDLQQDDDNVEAVQFIILGHACNVLVGEDQNARQDVLVFARTIHKLASYEVANNAPPLSQEIVRFLGQEHCQFKSSV